MTLPPALKSFVREHGQDDVHELALHARQYPSIDMQLAIRQITGRKIAAEKIPSWYDNESVIYPKHISMEQCSSEYTARYKASLVAGDCMTDLTGGLGVDFSFMAPKFAKEAVYVEQQKELSEIAAGNFDALGLDNVIIKNADAVDYLRMMPPTDLIYIDPSRRDNVGRKIFRIEDCTPNILDIEDLLEEKAGMAMIKLSPMLDISLVLKSLRNISDVHVVSVDNECKELLFVKQKDCGKQLIHCVNIQKDKADKFLLEKNQEEQAIARYASSVGRYLYEPNVSLLKAGVYKYISAYYKLDKLHPSSHLYTSDEFLPDFQGRRFVVDSICSLNKKDIKSYLSTIGHANITTRNFPLSVEEIRKRTKIKDGGTIYIFATTLSNEDKVLVLCRKT
ncbi:SAM-dependent methyltransferase [Dysgonomonas sp. 521]|uniref:class I SAM-dependent methyltransferase n=1 Tax=Dysgonomonas sp. 521 TaxID=2302932 RepID=UPI0013D7BD69|nr:class I SAM-dependent methyltransferase [Dysgonomonas sp. 521]NDV96282.1 SAM-dependent methyltransferase [Dysgonomonas sp. 521]